MRRNQQGLSENASYKIVALLITLILWVIILGSKDAVVIKKVPIEFLLPKNMMIVNSVPHELAFKVSGPRIALKKFSEQREPLTIDLTSAIIGLTTIKVHPDSINVPLGIRVLSLTPNTITPKLEEMVNRKLPIEVPVVGKPGIGFKLMGITTKPSEFEVSGSRSVVEALKSIKTEPVNITGFDTTVIREATLEVERPGVLPVSETNVQVTITIQKNPELKRRTTQDQK